MTLPILLSLDAAMRAANAPRKPLKVRRSQRLYDAPRPEALAAERAAYAASQHAVEAEKQAQDDATGGHQRHRRLRKVETLMATCRECGEAKIRWMAKQPEVTHIGYRGRQAADQYQVSLEE